MRRLIFCLSLIGCGVGISVNVQAVPKTIETADKNYKVNSTLFEDKTPSFSLFDLNVQSGTLWNKDSGMDVFFSWHPTVMGLVIGTTRAKHRWETMKVVPYEASESDNVASEFNSDAEILLKRSPTETFQFQVNHIGVSFNSPLYRGNSRTLMQLRGTWMLGTAKDSDYNRTYPVKGVALGASIAAPVSPSSRTFWNFGYTERFALLEGPGDLPRNERLLYVRISNLFFGLSILF